MSEKEVPVTTFVETQAGAKFYGYPTHVWTGEDFVNGGPDIVFISFTIAEQGGWTGYGLNHGERDLEEGDLFAVAASTIIKSDTARTESKS